MFPSKHCHIIIFFYFFNLIFLFIAYPLVSCMNMHVLMAESTGAEVSNGASAGPSTAGPTEGYIKGDYLTKGHRIPARALNSEVVVILEDVYTPSTDTIATKAKVFDAKDTPVYIEQLNKKTHVPS